MKKTLICSIVFLFFAVSATVYCVQYVDFNPFADINMQMRFRVKNMMNPVNPQDAATKQYVDDAVSGGVSYVTPEQLEQRISSYDDDIKYWGTTHHDELSSEIISSTNALSASFLSYVDDNITLTKAYASDKALTAEQNSRNYTDASVSLASEQLSSAIDGKLSKSGDTMSGDLSMGQHKISSLASPTDDYDAVNKKYLQSNYLPKNASTTVGGTLDFQGTHGIINVLIDSPNSVVTKSYVDSHDASVLASAKAYTDSQIAITNFLPLSGGTMSGAINMNNHRVSNLPSPLYSSDAATKSYVDARYNESLDFYYFDGFVFSSSPTDFSSRTFDFSFATNSTSGVIYAKILGCGTRYTKLGWLIKSPSHDSSDFSTSVSTVSGRGYDPGDVLAFHISTLFPLEYDSRFTATFQVYDDNHSSSACLVTFTGLPSPPTPPPLPDFDFSIELGSYVYPLDPSSTSHIDFPSSSISGDSYNFAVLITPTSSFSGSVPYTIDFDPASRVSPSSSQGSISSSSSAEVFFSASASYIDSFHLRIRVDSFDVEADIMAQTPTPPEPPSVSE